MMWKLESKSKCFVSQSAINTRLYPDKNQTIIKSNIFNIFSFVKMKIAILLAAMAFVAIMAAESENINNLLKREERSAVGGKRPGPNTRKKRLNKKRKQGKNAKKRNSKKGKFNRNQKKRIKQRKSERKVKVKTGKPKPRQQQLDSCVTKFRSFNLEMVQEFLRKDLRVEINNKIMAAKLGKVAF